MEFRLLGAFEVADGGRGVSLGPKPRTLLAILLLHRGEVVSAERLIEDLYAGEPPPTALKSLHVHVSRLRKALGDSSMRTVQGGYVLDVEGRTLDLDRMEELARRGRTALAAGDAAAASSALTEALGLWRGAPLADFRYAEWAQAEIARLDELRLAILEDRVEAELALGRHGELVGELDALVREHPLRERLRGQLMLALYRSGRQAEALDVYQDARRTLVDELGIDPGRSLRELEQAVLRQDPGLDLPALEPPVLATGGAEPEASPGPAPSAAAAETVARELRKTVSVVYVGLATTSSVPGASLDPEALRRVNGRIFGDVKTSVDRHGGTVETVTGDAMTAVFGLPAVHEDDALRAIRTAAEIKERLATLAAELERDRSTRLEFRIGVSTGEVVTGRDLLELRATGEPLHLSARLAHAAGGGDALIDERTRRLVRDAAVVEPVSVASISAFSLLAVEDISVGYSSRLDSPMVGRERERRRLHDAFEQAVADRSCQLFTVMGAAGVGKSRLVHEFLTDIGGDALIARGRCLAYGEGITYRPLIEAVRTAAALDETVDPEQGLRKLTELFEGEEDAERMAQRVAETIGLIDAVDVPEESFSAVATFFEALARRQPLVVVFDDIHWGETTFLDLVEYLADWTRDAPILLVCMARPELLDARPNWAGGKLNATSILLESLSSDESARLIENLAAGVIEAQTMRRIVDAAEGNPLFVEEMLALVLEQDRGDAELEVPPTIQALLAARLDRLTDAERAAIEAAAVEGKVFHEGSVATRVGAETQSSVHDDLMALVRKELIRPDPGEFRGERGFRFRHLLIRDAAYESIPKESRAASHERYAGWLERAAEERLAEYEEIIGYHLEQAYRYRSELGSLEDADRAVARRAADRLGAAGRRAFTRRDAPAAVNLLSRAASLLPAESSARLGLVPATRVAQGMGADLNWASEVLAEAIATGDEDLKAHALVQRGFLRLYAGPEVGADELIAIAEEAIASFERLGDDLGLARAWRLASEAHYLGRRAGKSAEAAESALVHARRARDLFEEREVAENGLACPLIVGPVPAAEGRARCERLLQEAAGDPVLEANALGALSYFVAIGGRADEAQELHARSGGVMDSFGGRAWLHSVYFAVPAVWEDDPVAVERELRPGYEVLKRIGWRSHLSSLAAMLAQAVYGQGRYDEAEELAGEARAAGGPNDTQCQTISRTVEAKVLAQRGDADAAENLGREALAFVEPSDFVPVKAEALADFAEILGLAGRSADAAVPLREALSLYEAKGCVLSAGKARKQLDELDEAGGRKAPQPDSI